MENGPFEDVFPSTVNMGRLHCYVSLPEGMSLFMDINMCFFSVMFWGDLIP